MNGIMKILSDWLKDHDEQMKNRGGDGGYDDFPFTGYISSGQIRAALQPQPESVDVEALKNECMAHFMKHRIGYSHNKSVAKTIPPLIDYLHAQGLLRIGPQDALMGPAALALTKAKMWLEAEPNAPKHFTEQGNEECRETIRSLIRNSIARHENT